MICEVAPPPHPLKSGSVHAAGCLCQDKLQFVNSLISGGMEKGSCDLWSRPTHGVKPGSVAAASVSVSETRTRLLQAACVTGCTAALSGGMLQKNWMQEQGLLSASGHHPGSRFVG